MTDILVVDLDGTLIKSDMLHESLWSSFNTNGFAALKALTALRHGKSALKKALYNTSDVDVTTLPFNKATINYIKKHREKGGYTALITGADHNFAEKITDHLELFDEAYGSNISKNLSGETKRDFILSKFGKNSFSYIGNAKVDLAIWQEANKIITVNASKHVRQKAEKIGKPIEHILSRNQSFFNYFRAIRVYQWLKNLLIFLPILAAHQINSETVINSVLGFFSFSLIASGVYILNDLLDLKSDRAHPRKRLRPFAAGDMPIANALFLFPALLVFGVVIGVSQGLGFLLVLLFYFSLTTLYSLKLKSILILDIFSLSGLYSLRVVAGGLTGSVDLSFWLIVFSTFFFLSLAAVKRQAELVDTIHRGLDQLAGRGYQPLDLPIINIISLGSGFAAAQVLALYINSETVHDLYNYPEFLWGVCCVLLYWVTRMVLITNRGLMTDDPIFFTIRDSVSQICLLLVLILVMLGVGF